MIKMVIFHKNRIGNMNLEFIVKIRDRRLGDGREMIFKVLEMTEFI